MERLLYLAVRGLVALIQALPLRGVARLGRALGSLAYLIDARHRRVAQQNLAMCFGHEKSPEEIRALARENYRRVVENFLCSVRTACMSEAEIRRAVEFVGAAKILSNPRQAGRSCVVAIGHFGNFELYARVSHFLPGFQSATTYRALPQPRLDGLMRRLREASGCLYFERLSEAHALRDALRQHRLILGLLADQHAGDRGLKLPFLGHDCSTLAAPALYALRYELPLYTGTCYRVALGRWRIEVGDEIPTLIEGQPRSIEAISLDINRAFEAAVRRDPANWFWVHRRWKPGKYRGGRAASAASPPASDEAGTG